MIKMLSTKDGSLLWQTDLGIGSDMYMTVPTVIDGEVFPGTRGMSGQGPYLLHAFNAQNGSEEWNARLLGQTSTAGILSIAA